MHRFFDAFQLLGLAFFLIVFVGRTLYLWLSQGINPLALGVGKKGFSRFLEWIFFVGLALWIIEVLWHALRSFVPLPPAVDLPLFESPLAQVIGAAVILAGLVVFVWALISFGNSWRIGIDKQTMGALVTTGLFAFSRNPIFLFVDLYFVGTFLLNGSLFFLVLALLVVPGLHYQILQEEKFLLRQYGQAYRDYCARTGRYFTLIPQPKGVL